MAGKRIVVTGGSGKAGRYIIEYLLEQGHSVLNLDLLPLPAELAEKVHTLKVDLTDGGQVYSALMSHFRLSEPFLERYQTPDAVLHLAGYARNMIAPDSETYRVNVLSAYNVMEACCRLGVSKIILASSICVYGVTFAEGDADFASFPVTEEIPVRPMDIYSISKLCMEKTAEGFARRFGVDIYALRIGAVIAPDEYQAFFEKYVNNPEQWKVHAWCYTDARDLGQMCHLGVMKDGLGFQIFNATNDEITNREPCMSFLQQQCPNVPITREMTEREAPLSNGKIKDLLGFREKHNWKQYYPLGA